MGYMAYLTLKGAKQGLISSGCNTKDSMGNRYQESHTDQITVLACHYSMSKLLYQKGSSHDGIQITKPKDKASPLLATAFVKQEHLEGSIDFYRINEKGHYEKFYSVAFQKTVISGVTDVSPHAVHNPSEEMHELIEFKYKGVQWEHLLCGTLAYDGWEDANSLAAMTPPLTMAERYAKQIKESMQESDKASNNSQINGEKKDKEKSEKKEESDHFPAFDLGWMQNSFTQSLKVFWENLFTSDTTEEQKKLVQKYNSHLNDPVRQGEIVVLPTSEPKTDEDKQSLSDLLEEAIPASKELLTLNDDELATVNRHLELLDHYSSEVVNKIKSDGLPSDYYAYASLGTGSIADGVGQHLTNINGILQEINDLYVKEVAVASKAAGINYSSFIFERAKLFRKLDGSFAGLSKRSINIPIAKQIRRGLNLSVKSTIHHADEIIREGVVPNLGKRMANISKGITTARGVGYVGLVLGAASGVNNIYDACSVDGIGQCGNIATREISGFAGGWGGGIIGGDLAIAGSLFVLGIIGVTSAPVIAIVSIGAAVIGGGAGGIIGATSGKAIGDILYESVIDLKELAEDTIEKLW